MPNSGTLGHSHGHGVPPRRRSPPLLVGGREMIKLARKDGAKLGDGLATPVVTGEGAINPSERADGGSGT